MLFIDAHEMGSKDYFFPPNADPIYHEITDESVSWINGLYGPAMRGSSAASGSPYFNYAVYDLFYMGYGDAVPTAGFLGAGMTFEKSGYDGVAKRGSASSTSRCGRRCRRLPPTRRRSSSGWAASYREALREGAAGELEPNEVVQPENTVRTGCRDIGAALLPAADDPAQDRRGAGPDAPAAAHGRVVRRLTARLTVPDYTPYAGAPASTTLPVGTYWISMAQPQKHWMQAMLNEDTYVPFPYFYDVTAWSKPLLFNVAGGRSGAVLHPPRRWCRRWRRRPSRRSRRPRRPSPSGR